MKSVSVAAAAALAAVTLFSAASFGSAAPLDSPYRGAAGAGFQLENWMGEFASVWGDETTLLDVSVPGTHDTMTYDLSDTLSDKAEDLPDALSWILHTFSGDVPRLGEFAKNQSKTQTSNVTAQLDGGVRFLDFRMQYTRSPEQTTHGGQFTQGKASADWYCLHLMESNQPALSYLQEVRDWMVGHPTEIVTMWISKHGSECFDGQYDDVEVEHKWRFWTSMEEIFGDMLVNHAANPINATSIASLVAANQRVVVYLADASNFTNASSTALNSCHIENMLGPGVYNNTFSMEVLNNVSIHTPETLALDKKLNNFFLLSGATGGGSETIVGGFYEHFFPGIAPAIDKRCVEALHIPNNSFCPQDLPALGRLSNYYMSIYMEHVAQLAILSPQRGKFPNAMYFDQLGSGGVILTGNAPYASDEHAQAAYAYADTILFVNLQTACAPGAGANASRCAELNATLVERRAQNPYLRWDDAPTGRAASWPPVPW